MLFHKINKKENIMLKNNRASNFLSKNILTTNINLPTTVEENCYTDSLSVLNDTEFSGNLQIMSNATINSLSVEGNFVVKGSTNFNGDVITNGNIDMQNNRVTDVSSPKNLTDGINLNVLKRGFPESFLGVTNHYLYWWWDADANYNWTSQLISVMSTDNISQYITFNKQQIQFLLPGIYKIGVTIGKSGYAGNGYGGFMQVIYTNNGKKSVMGSAGLLNSGVINAQGSIQTSVIVNKGETGGYIELKNANGSGFKMDYLVFSITVFPLFSI